MYSFKIVCISKASHTIQNLQKYISQFFFLFNINTTIKLVNRNGNTNRIFLSVNCQEFFLTGYALAVSIGKHRCKYSLGLYRDNYNEKKDFLYYYFFNRFFLIIITDEVNDRRSPLVYFRELKKILQMPLPLFIH